MIRAGLYDPGPPSGGEIPRHFYCTEFNMPRKTLSIFIDESGDFGEFERHSPYYFVTMVFHDQSKKIQQNLEHFDQSLTLMGYKKHAIHTAPLIRRESNYKNDLMENRKKLFNLLFNFARKLDINYDFFMIEKEKCKDVIDFNLQLSKSLSNHIKENNNYWSQFNNVIVYYDNGQIELTKIITSVFTALLPNVEFRKVKPCDYILFQVADLICTLELVEEKFNNKITSKSENDFFLNHRTYLKNYIKPIRKKRVQ